MSSKQFKILIILASGIGLAFLFKKGKISPEIRTSQKAAPSLAAETDFISPNEIAGDDVPKNREAARLSYNRMARLGVQVIPSTLRKDTLEMRLQILTPSAGCAIGEFDLMKNIVSDLAEKNFLISIDDEAQSPKPLFSRKISTFEVADNPLLLLTLPKASAEGKGLSISICANDTKKESCIGKRVLKPNEWQEEIGKTKPHDFLFYTQFFVVNKGVAYLAPTHRYDEANLNNLKESLKPIMKDFRGFDSFAERLRATSPVPARILKNGLGVSLPLRASGC